MITPADSTPWLTAAILAVYGAWQQIRAHAATKTAKVAVKDAAEAHAQAKKASADDLAHTNQNLADAFKMRAEEFKGLYETQHAEIQAYRAKVHEKAKEDTAIMLKLTEENASLRARTDLTPILEQLAEQGQTNREVAQTLTSLTATIAQLSSAVQSLVQHVPATKP